MVLSYRLIFTFVNILFLTMRSDALPSRNLEVMKSGVRVLSDTVRKLSNLLVARMDGEPISFGQNCRAGLKSGTVKDHQMTASSQAGGRAMHSSFKGRLDDATKPYNSWAAAQKKKGEWLQVDMQSLTYVTGVITQGRHECCDQWVTSYKIAYGNTEKSLQYIKDSHGNDIIFKGNRDRNTHVLNKFPHPVVARYFRLVAQTWHNHISLRMEYTTC